MACVQGGIHKLVAWKGTCSITCGDSGPERGRAHLLNDERHGRALVEQAQLAGGVLLVAWVSVDASVQQRAVEVAH